MSENEDARSMEEETDHEDPQGSIIQFKDTDSDSDDDAREKCIFLSKNAFPAGRSWHVDILRVPGSGLVLWFWDLGLK